MLNMPKVELEFFSNADMYLFFVKSIRDGVSYTSKKYSAASNKYLKSYYQKQESKHFIYLDVKNLDGYVMPKFLPTSRFKWIVPKEYDLNRYTSNIFKACFLEADL